MENLNQYIDHTLLKPTATEAEIIRLCKEAQEYRFFSVCVNSCHVALAKEEVAGSDVKLCSVVGFPLGAMSTQAKMMEANKALVDGADEIDMVMNIGWLKSKNFEAVANDIRAVKQVVGKKVLKVILETCYLEKDELVSACRIALQSGADFVKTSTGFGTGGATEADVTLMLKSVNGKAKVKASGGIKDRREAVKYITLGAARIGTSSGVAIVTNNYTDEHTY